MSIGCAEPDRAKDAGQEGDVVIVEILPLELAALVQPGDHVETQDVGFSLLRRAVLLLQRFSDGTLAVDGVLDTEAVSHLVEHYVGEKSVELDMSELILGDQLISKRHEDLVKLGLH